MKEVVSLGSLKTVEEAFDVTRTDMHDLLEGGLLLFEEAMVACLWNVVCRAQKCFLLSVECIGCLTASLFFLN